MTGDNDPWPGRIARLVDELSEFMQEPVTVVKYLVHGDAFACFVRSSPPQGAAFQFCWEGVFGMEPVDGDQHISASLFLYSRNKRLALPGHAEGSVLEVQYEGSLEHGGRWTDPYWAEDVFGEYVAYDSYGDD